MTTSLDVLYQFNEKYAPFAGISITSLFDNNQDLESIRVFILGEDISVDNKVLLQKTADYYSRNIVFIDCGEQFSKMKEYGMPSYRGSYAANLRLFLPLFLDDFVDRLIYLDADTIIDDSLEALLSDTYNDYPLYMALDSLGTEHKFEIGLDESEDYFNSGVIVFNLSQWKTLQLTEKIIDHVKNVRSNYPAPDQDLLNVVCCGMIGRLDPVYNMQPVHLAFQTKHYYQVYSGQRYYSQEEIDVAKKKPCIYHFFRFLGQFPWNEGNIHPDNRLFDHYMSKSLWNDFTKLQSDKGVFFRIERLLYRILPSLLFLYIFKISHRLFIRRSEHMSLKNRINPSM